MSPHQASESPIAPLGESLEQLKSIMTRYEGSKHHLVSDIVLYNFALDVREQAEAVLALATTDIPRASYANARAALEAARDLAFLTAEERHYDFRAASARICELFEYHELRQRAPSLPELAQENLQLIPEEVAQQDAEDWDAQAPGMGATLRSALDAVQRDGGRLRQHWSGLKQADLLGEIGKHWGGDALYPKVFEVLQAILAMSAHPRPRTGARTVEIRQDDTFVLGTRDADYEMPKTCASLASLMAVEALKRRAAFSKRGA